MNLKFLFSNMKNAHYAMGNKEYSVSKAEKKYETFAKKYLVAKKNLKKGHYIKNHDVISKD